MHRRQKGYRNKRSPVHGNVNDGSVHEEPARQHHLLGRHAGQRRAGHEQRQHQRAKAAQQRRVKDPREQVVQQRLGRVHVVQQRAGGQAEQAEQEGRVDQQRRVARPVGGREKGHHFWDDESEREREKERRKKKS